MLLSLLSKIKENLVSQKTYILIFQLKCYQVPEILAVGRLCAPHLTHVWTSMRRVVYIASNANRTNDMNIEFRTRINIQGHLLSYFPLLKPAYSGWRGEHAGTFRRKAVVLHSCSLYHRHLRHVYVVGRVSSTLARSLMSPHYQVYDALSPAWLKWITPHGNE